MGGTVRMGGVETIMSYTSLLRVKGQFETVKSSTKLLLRLHLNSASMMTSFIIEPGKKWREIQIDNEQWNVRPNYLDRPLKERM